MTDVPDNKPLPPQYSRPLRMGEKGWTPDMQVGVPHMQPPVAPRVATDRNRGKAIAALTLGIVSLVFAFILNIFAFPALAGGIIGFILAMVAYKDQAMARAATWVCGGAVGVSIYGIYEVVHALHQVTGV
jgi:hypothetical protein